MEQELRQQLGSAVDVTLIAGSGGVYEVEVDGKNIFSKKKLGRFPDEGEIIRLIST